MAYKQRLLLLTASLYLIIATELRTTAVGTPQRSSLSTHTKLLRFQPISHKQYQSIMKLSSGKPVISEDRLINSNYRSLSSIRKSITNMMMNNKHRPRKTRRYPLCVIETNLKSTKRRNRNGAYYGEMMYQSPYARLMTGGVQRASSRGSVKCIVVTPPIENCHTNPNAPGCLDNCDPNQDPECPGYCSLHPKEPGCCDPNKDPGCPGYCSLHPTDPKCCNPNDDPRCPGYCALHPNDPDCCDPKVVKECPGYCEFHPDDLTCCDPDVEGDCPVCDAAVDPDCPGYCPLHLLEPRCADFCENNPGNPQCCLLFPGSPNCLEPDLSRYSKYSRYANTYSVYPIALPKYDYGHNNARQF